MIEAASATQQARNAQSAPHATGGPPTPPSPPPDATPAADAQLTPSALRCVIGYLACNAVPGVHTNHGSLAASPVAGALDGPQPCLLAESLFSAAAQAPSSYSAAAAGAAAAATTSPVPVTPTSVTRPLALLAASPRTRRELERHLVGGCALPPLGALVLQVQAHIAAPPPSARWPARDGAASHAERRRRRIGRRRKRSPSATPPPPPPPSPWQLLVSSANVAVAALPFQPARSPPPSAALPGLLPQSTATPPPPSPAQRPPRPVHPPVCATPPLQATQTPTGRSPVPSVKTPVRSVGGASPPLPPLLASRSPVIQSRRLPLRMVTPVDSSGPVTPPRAPTAAAAGGATSPVVSASPTSAATTPHSSAIPLPRRPPVSVVPFAGAIDDASGGSDDALGASSLPRLSGPLPATPLTAGPAPAAVGPRGGASHASSSLPSPRLLSAAASSSTSTPPPTSRPPPSQRQQQHQSSPKSPPSVPAPLQTLCHALWWVRRGPLPVSLSLLRYKAADVQALWAALAATSTAACEVGSGLESDARGGEGEGDEGAVALSEAEGPAADDSEPSSSRSSSRSADSATVTTPSAGATPAAASLTAPAHNDVNRPPQASARRRTPPPPLAPAPPHAVSIVPASINAATGARRPLNSPVLTPKTPPTAKDAAHPRAGGATSAFRRSSSPTGVTPVRAAGAARAASPSAAAVPPSPPPLATAAVPHPTFTQLHVHGKAADAALAALLLPAHPEVRTLRLTHGTLADTQLEHLARACPDVTHLSLAMNNAIRTTAFLCPTPSDTASVATTTTLTATTTTWTATATATATTKAVPVPASTATPACSAAAGACGAGCVSPTQLGASQRHPSFLSSSAPLRLGQLHQRDAARAALELSGGSGGGGGGNGGSMSIVGSDNDDATGDAAGACAAAASVATATVPLSPRSSSWPRRPSALGQHNSQLDLFAPDEEGELEMRLSLWQAAQTDAAERRQPVFILRPEDVVLGHGGGQEGAGNRCAARRESREAAAARAWRRDSADMAGAFSGSVPAPRAPASPSAAALLLAHFDLTRVHLAEALRALSPPRATPSSTPAAAAAGATYHSPAAPTATSVHTHTDPHTQPRHNTQQQQQQHRASRRQRRAVPPRVGSTSQTELSASLLQHSAPTSARSHSAHGAASRDATALQATRPTSPRARDRRRRSRGSRDAPAAAVAPLLTTDALHSHRRRHQHTRDGSREAQTTAAAADGVAPRGASADLPARRRRRPHWADTLVDLDLSYTHIPDADAARDVPQLRRLCRLSLEGCMRLVQIAWLPQLTLLRELNLSLSSIHGTALYPLGCCARLVWLKLEGCASFTAVQQLWLQEEPAPPHALAASTPTPPPHLPPPLGTPNAAAAGGGGAATGGHAAPGRAVWHSVVSGIPAITVLPPPGGLASVSRAVASRDALALHRGGGASGAPVESAAPSAPAASRSPHSPQAPPPPLLDELRTLIATGTGLTNEGLRKLPEMVGLECLVMDRCPGLSDVGDVAAALPSLHTLDLSRTRVTAEGLAALRHSRTLRQLRLQDCAALTRLPALLVCSFAASTSKATSSSVPPHLPLTALDLSYSKHLAPDGLAGLVAADEAAAAFAAGANQEARRPGSRAASVLSAGSGAAALSRDDVVATPTFSCVRHVLLRACDGLVHLDPLQRLSRVVELDLYHTSVTEATLTSALASWTCLEVLNIASTRVRSLAAWCPSTDASDGASASEEAAGRLPAFAATLRVLVLSNTEVTSHGLAALRHFRQLEVLQLSNCRHLRDLSFLPLAAAAVTTTSIDDRSAAAAAAAARRRTALTELSVTEATLLTDAAAFPFLASCPGLRTLSLAGCALLCTNGPNTAAEQERGGVVQPAAPVVDGDVGAVGRLTALVELNLSSTGISLTGLRMLLAQGSASASECVAASSLYTACLSLQRLWLRGCRHLDEAALMSAAAAATAVVREGSGEVAPAPLPPPHRPRLPPQLREVYLSHGKYGAAVLAGVQ